MSGQLLEHLVCISCIGAHAYAMQMCMHKGKVDSV